MHRDSEGTEGSGLSLNKGVELLLRRKRPSKRVSFGKIVLPFTDKEVSFYLEIKKR
jgi:hypothetical protein|tara:strand:- start:995 stop:1162 length:168 start_codon:yes stop_codon:yes gene_type:complete